jgi:hypothetical protein
MSHYTASQFVADLDSPYAWPGGYPRYFVTADGAALSYAAARENADQIKESVSDNDTGSGWCVVACEINWEDADLICDHTGQPIESAYAE